MIHSGLNKINGVSVEVLRKNTRRMSIRIAPDGVVRLSVPKWRSTLQQGEFFILSKWNWVLKTRNKVLSRPPVAHREPCPGEINALGKLLTELNAAWGEKLGESNVAWSIRAVKTYWGCCHWRTREIIYNAELAHAPRELVEYVVVHELTHFAVHNHGPLFYVLMDERLPPWRTLRQLLNKREWGRDAGMSSGPHANRQADFVQLELW